MSFYFKENIVDNVELSAHVKNLLHSSVYGVKDQAHFLYKKTKLLFVGTLIECHAAVDRIDACFVVVSVGSSAFNVDDIFPLGWEILIDTSLPNCFDSCLVRNIKSTTSRVQIVIPSIDALYYAIYIISNVKYRMGDWFFTKFTPVGDDVLSNEYCPIDVTHSSAAMNQSRAVDVVTYLEGYLKNRALIQFKDNVNQNPIIYFKSGILRPIFAFNRHVKYSSSYVLWPLSTHQKYGSRDFDEYFSDMDMKIFEIFWRGSAMGSVNNKQGRALFFKRAIENYKNCDPFVAKLIYSCYPRFRFVLENYDLPSSNIGFSSVIPNFEYLTKPRVDLVEANRYFFQVAVDGNDLPSSLPWQLLNSNVTLIPELNYESIFTYGLLPWVNFVPIRADFCGLIDLKKSLLSERHLLEYISSNARRYMLNFSDSLLQGRIDKALTFHYSNMEY